MPNRKLARFRDAPTRTAAIPLWGEGIADEQLKPDPVDVGEYVSFDFLGVEGWSPTTYSGIVCGMAINLIGPPIEDGDDGYGNPIYRIKLSDEPDQNWIDAFAAGPLVGSLNTPRVDGDEIVITVPKSGSLKDHLANIEARRDCANRLVPKMAIHGEG